MSVQDKTVPATASLLRVLLLLFLLQGIFAAQDAMAVELTITAEFRPSALDPSRSKFVNTTPSSGYCQVYPIQCDPKGIFSIATGITATNKIYDKNSTDRRSWSYMNGDTVPREVLVTSVDGSVSQMVKVRLSLIGISTYVNGTLGPVLNGWLGSPGIAGPEAGGCVTVGPGRGVGTPANPYHYAWQFPESGAAHCFRRISGSVGRPDTAVATYGSLDFGYEMEAPDPLSMPNGRYRGTVQYSVGAGADIDAGQANYSDSLVILNFDLTVQHNFKVDFPSGLDRVVLAPRGGWAQWTDHGRAPRALEQEIPFQLTSSGAFSVRLICQYPLDVRCGIRHAGNGEGPVDVPVDISVTIPGAREAATGVPALETPLSTRIPGLAFQPSEVLAYRSSRIGLSVSGDGLARMLEQPGSTWSGAVTVVFDAQL